jgi:hypothetical protein
MLFENQESLESLDKALFIPESYDEDKQKPFSSGSSYNKGRVVGDLQ